jgi:hypothetical protein
MLSNSDVGLIVQTFGVLQPASVPGMLNVIVSGPEIALASLIA